MLEVLLALYAIVKDIAIAKGARIDDNFRAKWADRLF